MDRLSDKNHTSLLLDAGLAESFTMTGHIQTDCSRRASKRVGDLDEGVLV